MEGNTRELCITHPSGRAGGTRRLRAHGPDGRWPRNCDLVGGGGIPLPQGQWRERSFTPCVPLRDFGFGGMGTRRGHWAARTLRREKERTQVGPDSRQKKQGPSWDIMARSAFCPREVLWQTDSLRGVQSNPLDCTQGGTV